jgi:hypothetical protein
MLSKNNAEKISLTGLYKKSPESKYRSKFHENNLYHCCNWTFTIFEENGLFFAKDTYWSSGDNLVIEIMDDNINEFQLIFELDKVKKIKKEECRVYDKYYVVAIDSGGWNYPKYFTDKEADKSEHLILMEINEEIEETKDHLSSLIKRRNLLKLKMEE